MNFRLKKFKFSDKLFSLVKILYPNALQEICSLLSLLVAIPFSDPGSRHDRLFAPTTKNLKRYVSLIRNMI